MTTDVGGSPLHTLAEDVSALGGQGKAQRAIRLFVLTGTAVERLRHLSPARQFQVASLFVVVLGMLGTGWWMNHEVELAEDQESLRLNTLYVSNFVSPLIQNVNGSVTIPPRSVAYLNSNVKTMLSHDGVVGLYLWARNGKKDLVLYCSEPDQIGKIQMPDAGVIKAFSGNATWATVSESQVQHELGLTAPRDVRGFYTPVRDQQTNRILAVAEVYKDARPTLDDIAVAQQHTWLVAGGAALLIYAFLFGFIESISNTIVRQQARLRQQVARLGELLAQNEDLRDRARGAAHRVATLHERALREVGSDLHDGPAQYLGVALLRLDVVAAYHERHPDSQRDEHLAAVKFALTQAMEEVRTIAAGLLMPHLEAMTLPEVVAQAVADHERTSHTRVQVVTTALPEQVTASIKTTLYRILQEGLNNAFRHGGGIDEQVTMAADNGMLTIQIADSGPGFEARPASGSGEHMGIPSMRDRVESLGGRFGIVSGRGKGTQIQIALPLLASEDQR
jgi:signal transduction histidine kinase